MSPWLKEFTTPPLVTNVTKSKYNSTSRSNILIKPNQYLILAATTWREEVLTPGSQIHGVSTTELRTNQFQ
jgi:hypothetical protein